MRGVVPRIQSARSAGGRCLLSFLYGNLFWLQIASSQRSAPAFGPFTETTLDFPPAGIALYAGPGSAEIAVGSSGDPSIRFFSVTDAGEIVLSRTEPVAFSQNAIFSGNVYGNGTPDLIALSSDRSAIAIIGGARGGVRTIMLPAGARPERLLVADVNNDGRSDIALFGKSMAGIATVLGGINGTFREGPLLFPEISVVDASVVDMNGDRINDILLLNWLSNQMALFFGLSKTLFSEQVTLDLPGEPAALTTHLLRRGRGLRVAVAFPERREILTYTADGAGEFRREQSVACAGKPYDLRSLDLTGDDLPDLLAPTEYGFMVAAAENSARYSAGTLYGSAGSDFRWHVGDVDGDRRNDLLVVESRPARLWVAAGSGSGNRISWPSVYLVGASPRGVALADVNRDGALDICLANARAASVSILLNKGGGRFDGHETVTVSDGPSSLTPIERRSASGPLLVASHPEADRLSVITWESDTHRSTTLTIPTGPHPSVLHADVAPGTDRLKMLVRTRENHMGAMLSLFEQTREDQFLERRFRANLPRTVSALTIGRFVSTQTMDLIIVTDRRSPPASHLSLAPAVGSGEIRSVSKLFSIPDSVRMVSGVTSGDVDGDGTTDLILIANGTRPALGFSFGQRGGTFREGVYWIPGVRPRHDNIVVSDVNRDGTPDIVLQDNARGSILALYGEGSGRFSPPRVVVGGDGIGGFAVGRIREGPSADLVVTREKKGTVTVLFSAFMQ